MVGGKAMVDLRNLDRCDLDGECVRICPTRVISLHTEPYEPPAQDPLAELTAEEAARLAGAELERALGGPVVLGLAGPGAPTSLPPAGGKNGNGVHLPILRT
jgi:ferredoxin